MTTPLRYNVSWTFLGNTVYTVCRWGMIVVIARLGGAEVVGRFTLGLAVCAPVMILCNLALRPAMVTDAKGEYEFLDYFSLRVYTTILALLLIFGIVGLAGYQGEIVTIILTIGLAKGVESIIEIFYALEQRHERLDLVGCSLILRGIIGFTALAVGYYISGFLFVGIIAMAAAWTAVWLLYDLRVSKKWWKESNNHITVIRSLKFSRFGRLRSIVLLTLPIGVASMLASLAINIPRYFIEHYLGEESLGIFGAMAYFIVAGGMVINAIGQAASPRLSNYFAQINCLGFRKLLMKILLITFVISGIEVLMAVLFGQEILTILYGNEFAQNAPLFVWVMVVATISNIATILGFSMTSMRVFKIQPYLFLVICCVSVFTCLWLVPMYNLLGAVWAWACALCIQLALVFFVNLHHISLLSKSSEIVLSHNNKQFQSDVIGLECNFNHEKSSASNRLW